MVEKSHISDAFLLPPLAKLAGAVYDSLVEQTRDAVQQAGYGEVVLGLSGGLDSALVATIAADALGGECVHGVMMPSVWTSEASVLDAEELARRLGIELLTLPIMPAYEALSDTLEDMGDKGVGSFCLAGFSKTKRTDPFVSVTEQNLQARIRGVLLMALSNKHRWFVLAPCNKSELSTGYITLYGDMAGSFMPLAPVYKSWVYELAHMRNARAEAAGMLPPIPESILTKQPSAELAPGQSDEADLGSYEHLDALLHQHLTHKKQADELVQMGFEPTYVEDILKRVTGSAFKRAQACPGARIELMKLR